MSFFSKIASAVTEQLGGYLTDQLIAALDPAVRSEIGEHVTEFRDNAVRSIPGTIEQQLTAGESSDSVVTSLVSSVLSGRTGPLVEKVLRILKPQIDQATAGLPDSITDEGISRVRQFLDVSQGKSSEQTSRSLGSQVKDGLSAAVDGFLNLDDHLVDFLDNLREQLHPLFEALKPKLWDIIPAVVQQALQAVLHPDSDESAGQEQPPQPEGTQARGLIGDFIKNTLSDQVVDQAPQLLEVVKAPIQDLIANIVDTLEKQCNEAFGTKLRAELAERNLISQ